MTAALERYSLRRIYSHLSSGQQRITRRFPLRALAGARPRMTVDDLRVGPRPRHMRFAHVGNRRYVIRQFATLKAVEQMHEQEKAVVKALRHVGVEVESVWDLLKRPTPKPAVPILIDQLQSVTDSRVMEGIVRALSIPRARPIAAKPLVELFPRLSDVPLVQWAVGNALAVVADDSVADPLLTLLFDRRHGRAREMLATALARLSPEIAVPALRDALLDPEIAGHALAAVRKHRATDLRPLVERLVGDDRQWVRRSARRTLADWDGH